MQKWLGFESIDAECGHSCWGDNKIRSSNNSFKKIGENACGKLKVYDDCK